MKWLRTPGFVELKMGSYPICYQFRK